jgi:hypothetical protein
MFSQRLVMDAAIEVSQSSSGLYRIADTSSVFIKNQSLEVTKDVIKAFQIIPDTLKVIREYHHTGTIQHPFTATIVFLRNLTVELELLSRCSGPSEENDEWNKSINTTIGVLHIVAMGCFAYHALLQIRESSKIPRPTRLQIHRRRESQLVVITAVAKIAQQTVDLLGSSYENLLKVLTLIFNVCALTSYAFGSTAVRKHYKKPA